MSHFLVAMRDCAMRDEKKKNKQKNKDFLGFSSVPLNYCHLCRPFKVRHVFLSCLNESTKLLRLSAPENGVLSESYMVLGGSI